jgi:hypothetical protein
MIVKFASLVLLFVICNSDPHMPLPHTQLSFISKITRENPLFRRFPGLCTPRTFGSPILSQSAYFVGLFDTSFFPAKKAVPDANRARDRSGITAARLCMGYKEHLKTRGGTARKGCGIGAKPYFLRRLQCAPQKMPPPPFHSRRGASRYAIISETTFDHSPRLPPSFS